MLNNIPYNPVSVIIPTYNRSWGLQIVAISYVFPIPGICWEGAYGILASGRRPQQVAYAPLEREMRAWETGQSAPKQIAAFWQPRLSATKSVQQILEMVKQGRLEAVLPSLVETRS